MKRVISCFIFGTVMFFVLNTYVLAEVGCSKEKIQSFKEKVEVINATFEFDYSAAEIGVFNQYVLTVYNGIPGFYIQTHDGSVKVFYDDFVDGVATDKISTFAGDLEIYSNDCPGIVLKTIKSSLKKYNIYSEYDVCKGLENKVDVCNKFYDKELDYDKLMSEIQKYKKENEKSNIMKDSLLSFLKKNIIWVAVAIILVVCIISLLIFRNIKKNRLD